MRKQPWSIMSKK